VLHELLRVPPETGLADPGACIHRAREIRDAYRRLDRTQLSADEVLEIKFASLYWRHRVVSDTGRCA
jgi:hypothetical protein